MQTEDYQAWFSANEHWLTPYAVFCILRDLFGTSEHQNWGALSSQTPEVSNFSPLHCRHHLHALC